MRYCGVLDCPQKGPTDTFGNKVTYHRVPAKEPLRKLWIQKIRRRDYLYNFVSCIFVCSLHFEEADFMKGVANKKRCLLNGVVPSKFSWKPFENRENSSKKKAIEGTISQSVAIKLEDPSDAIPDESFTEAENNTDDKTEILDLDMTVYKDSVLSPEQSAVLSPEQSAVLSREQSAVVSPEQSAVVLENENLKKLVADLNLKVKLLEKRNSELEFKLKESDRLLNKGKNNYTEFGKLTQEKRNWI